MAFLATHLRLFAAALALSWVLADPAQAAPLTGAGAGQGKGSQAQGLSEQGYAAYGVGRYDEAITAFTRAYELDPAPVLLFNIAQAHWKKGDNAQALTFYRRYLAADPRDESRPRAEARVRELEARLGQEPAPVAVTPAPASAPVTAVPAIPPPPPEERPAGGLIDVDRPATATGGDVPPERQAALYRRPWFWGVVGAAVLGAVVVAVVAAGGRSDGWTCGTDCLDTHRISGK